MCLLFTLVIVWLSGGCSSLLAVSQKSIISYIASPGKAENSKFEVKLLLNAYHFCIIMKLKNPNLNHHKAVTTYIYTAVDSF